MKNPNENRNAWLAGLITALLILWLIMSVGCMSPTDRKLKEPGHWPGWIVEPPFYGPHDQQTQIDLRNAYSDGWQDRGEAPVYE